MDILVILAALLGIVIRVAAPYWTKKAEANDLTWKWNEALPPIIGGIVMFAVLLASGTLTGVETWTEALYLGLFSSVATLGASDFAKIGVRFAPVLGKVFSGLMGPKE